MLYTRKGDDGTTKTFGCDQRVSKSSAIAEALGSLDEINSYLGFCKIKVVEKFPHTTLSAMAESVIWSEIVHLIQKNLFIIQAEIAGSKMSIGEEKVRELESIVDAIEKELPPIKSFFISGGTELASLFDVARTLVRRAERRVVSVSESASAHPSCKAMDGHSEASSDKEGKISVGKWTLAYLNRLSSVLYAFARLANHKSGIVEESPDYK